MMMIVHSYTPLTVGDLLEWGKLTDVLSVASLQCKVPALQEHVGGLISRQQGQASGQVLCNA